MEDETEKEIKVDFSLYTNQWDCLLNVPFSEIIIIIVIIDYLYDFLGFVPAYSCYLASVVPGIWLMNFDLYEKRIAYRDSMGLTDCSTSTSYNSTSLSADLAGVRNY